MLLLYRTVPIFNYMNYLYRIFILLFIIGLSFSSGTVFAQEMTSQLEYMQGILRQLQEQARVLQTAPPPSYSFGDTFDGPLVLALSRNNARIDIEELPNGTFDIWARRAVVVGVDATEGVLTIDAIGLWASIGVSSSTRIVSQEWEPIDLSHFSIGDRVNVWGIYANDAPVELFAKTVRRVK